MATWLLMLARAFFVFSFYGAAFVEGASFPTIKELVFAYYTTEVQITDVEQAASAYAVEYYNSEDVQGSVRLYFQGDVQSIYVDNSTFQIMEVNDVNCTVVDEDTSIYYYKPMYYGWLNVDPLIIGPSAPLWYAQGRRDSIVDKGTQIVRNIPCDKFELPIQNKLDNLTIEYYFAPEGWETPYKYEKLRVPIRIRVVGESSRYSADTSLFVPVDQRSDFAYFKPNIDDFNNLLPPIGLGCRFKEETDNLPEIPEVFQFSAEKVDLLNIDDKSDVEIQFQRTFFDHPGLLARKDTYSRKKGFSSSLYDFSTGVMYTIQNDGSCRLGTMREVDFEIIDYGMTNRMMTAKEYLNLDGTFYEMGKREIRGLRCDTYESVTFDTYYMYEKYYKLVVTVYFTESKTSVGINGETESRIPVYYIITGWKSASEKTLQVQYNIFQFDDVIWPEMYSTFKLERCYTKAESRAYFVLVLEVPSKDAAAMEELDELIIRELRTLVSQHAKVSEMRIPYLKADYKPTGVYVTGVMLERPPALLQFFKYDSGPTTTYDPDLKVIVEAKNLEECSYACVDEGDFPCKGFYFCNKACFLKSTDPFEKGEGEEKSLGECDVYMRDEIESTTYLQSYLSDALGNLETAVLNQTMPVRFPIKNGEEIVIVRDIVIGDGPYTGVDIGDKPFNVGIPLRKLNTQFEKNKKVEYAVTLHDCYKRCKEAGSLCSSFSFCPESPNDNKECTITSDLVMQDLTKDSELLQAKFCNIYNLKFLDYFTAYPERVSLLPGDKVYSNMESLDTCARSCRLEKDFTCRGFEYCRSMATCTLHKKHILDLKPGESGTGSGRECTHYAARYVTDYMDMGGVLIDDKSNIRYDTTLDECAKICSEELKEDCKSFNFCPGVDFSQSTCALSKKLLRDDKVSTTEDSKCAHYEKRDIVHDWDRSNLKSLTSDGYTKKGFTGLVIGMIALGLIVGALGFVLYSYIRSKSSGDGLAVRFMKSET